MTLKTTLAAPFYHSRAKSLGKSELIYYYAFDRRWMDKEKVDLLLRRGIEQKLIGTDGEMFYPLFDISSIQIPVGFRPSSSVFDIEDAFQQLLDRISTHTGISGEGIISEMNKLIQEQYDENIRPEAALVVVAKLHNVTVTDLIPALSESLKKTK
jgi:hypothetical protein